MTTEASAYPFMPLSRWWELRSQFRRSIPTSLTSKEVAALLNMNEKSATANILPTMRMLGLIDQDGKTIRDVAVKWREDDQYKEVCAEMIKHAYPQELRELFSDPLADQEGIRRWFANDTGGGRESVRRITAFYVMLLEADPNKQTETIKQSPTKKPTKLENGAKRDSTPKKVEKIIPLSQVGDEQSEKHSSSTPAINININIEISSDTSIEQIDRVLASVLNRFSGVPMTESKGAMNQMVTNTPDAGNEDSDDKQSSLPLAS